MTEDNKGAGTPKLTENGISTGEKPEIPETEQVLTEETADTAEGKLRIMVRSPGMEEDTIDLGNVLRNAAAKSRLYVWVVLLCLAAGVSAALLYYQFTKPYLTVSSVVTLDYEVPDSASGGMKHVEDLTAPDGNELDLGQITSSYVLQTALDGLELSQPVSLTNLRNNIRVDRILAEDSRRQQEVASNMIEDKNNGAYNQVKEIELKYVNRFVVSLTNGFGDEDARVKEELTDSELRLLLDRILDAYNTYLTETYAEKKLPDDEISVIDIENLDVMESLDMLRTAAEDLDSFCRRQPERVREYRSWQTGLSLNDLTTELAAVLEHDVEYLYSYVYTNGIVFDRKTMLTNFEYDLRNFQTELSVVRENISTNQDILRNYVNEQIYVTMQENNTAKTTRANTDYYNSLFLQQASNYAKAAELDFRIAELNTNIGLLQESGSLIDPDDVKSELDKVVTGMQGVYGRILSQFEEIEESPFYNTYAGHSVAQGKSVSFLKGASKPMALGGAAGLVIALGLWFCSALLPEMTGGRDRKESAGK